MPRRDVVRELLRSTIEPMGEYLPLYRQMKRRIKRLGIGHSRIALEAGIQKKNMTRFLRGDYNLSCRAYDLLMKYIVHYETLVDIETEDRMKRLKKKTSS